MTSKEAIKELIFDKVLCEAWAGDGTSDGNLILALDMAIEALKKQIQITNDRERIREAIMRLSMCARKECGICKYKDRPKDLLPSDDCKERSTKNINLLADLLLIEKGEG